MTHTRSNFWHYTIFNGTCLHDIGDHDSLAAVRFCLLRKRQWNGNPLPSPCTIACDKIHKVCIWWRGFEKYFSFLKLNGIYTKSLYLRIKKLLPNISIAKRKTSHEKTDLRAESADFVYQTVNVLSQEEGFSIQSYICFYYLVN